MKSLLHPAATPPTPSLLHLTPSAALPGGTIHVHGTHLGPIGPILPYASIADVRAATSLARPTEAVIRVPDGATSGDLIVFQGFRASNALPVRIATPIAENLHPVANPAVDPLGNIYTTVSGTRGQQVPVSIFRVLPDFQVVPFVREILNSTGLAFDPDGNLFVSSRADGAVYRVSPTGAITTFAEGLGLATGLAFDTDGNLYVGDRSGTIFKVSPTGQIFVYSTLEPSMAAYHLAFSGDGVLYVTGPTTSSNQIIHAIDRDGTARVFFSGLGRAQGLAFDTADNLYVAASLRGERGIVRITPEGRSSLIVAGNNLVGLAFLEDGFAALTTRDALFHIELGIEGRKLV